MKTNIRALNIICEDLKDAEKGGEINIIDWLSDMNCAVEELAELGIKEAIPIIHRLKEIEILLEIIKED